MILQRTVSKTKSSSSLCSILLAGGLITEIREVDFVQLPEDSEEELIGYSVKKCVNSCRHFLLFNRSDLLKRTC